MATDPATLEHLCRLARLALTPEETARLGADLTRVVAMMDALAATPVDGLAPLAHPLELTLSLREDAVSERDRSDELLALAAEAQGGYYLVPRVIE